MSFLVVSVKLLENAEIIELKFHSVGHDYLTGNIPEDAGPALLWCGRLAASSAAWAALHLGVFNWCSGTLKGAQVGATWAVVSRSRSVIVEYG